LAELIGTFALTFIGAGAILANETLGSGGFGLLGVALAHGLVLAIFVSGTIHISGGHINPAVTLGFMITQCIHPGVGLLYMISQLLGAALAAGLLTALFPQEIWGKVALGAPQLGETVSFGIGVLVEAVLTFFLVFTVFATAVDPRGPKSIAGFGIGLVLVFDMIVGGPLTGAAMNPARAFGPTLAVNLSEVWSDHLVYWIGPLLGGGLAALVYHYGLGEEAKPAAAAPTRAARGRRTPPA
jgi:aquaporin Z